MKHTTEQEPSIKGKNILITGGTKGIGRATAMLLTRNFGNVFILGRNATSVNETIKDIYKNTGTTAHGIACDVTDQKNLKKVFKFIYKKAGPLDVLINNASLGARSVLDQDIEDLEYILKVNMESYMRCTRFALDQMIPRNHGHIINIGSLSASVFEKDADIYVATKSAIAGFTRSIRKKVNKHSIKVTLIESGSVATSMVDEDEKTKIYKVNKHLFLKPEDIANIILFSLLQPQRSEIMKIQLKPHKQFLK